MDFFSNEMKLKCWKQNNKNSFSSKDKSDYNYFAVKSLSIVFDFYFKIQTKFHYYLLLYIIYYILLYIIYIIYILYNRYYIYIIYFILNKHSQIFFCL